MKMTRKGFLTVLGACACGGALGASSTMGGALAGTGVAKQRAVYHVSEIEKIPFALMNINNHIDGVGGPDGVAIVVVVHGDGYRGFLRKNADLGISQDVEMLEVQGVRFEVCGLTLDAFHSSVQDLVGSFHRLEEGAMVRLTELQMDGYAYLRP